VLTAVVTQVGGSYTVHLTDAPPSSTPVEETNSSEAPVTSDAATDVTIGAEEEHHDNVTLNSDGYVANDGVAHIGVDEAAPGPNPIVPEIKEVAWGAGAFIVFALVMRYLAFPKLKKGMDARYAGIQSDHEQAAAARAAAQSEVAEYQAQLASVKAEAAAQLDQARQELEAKRTARIAAANAEINERRAAATAENDAARAAVQSQIKGAVADVSSSAIRLAIGKDPDPTVVERVVDDVMSAGATR
jgi:F-type H+-transporting ATPase subunit b